MSFEFKSIIVIAFVLSVFNANAECMDDEGTTASLYAKCYKPTFDVAVSEMKKEIKLAQHRIKNNPMTATTSAVELLINSQKSWENYRDQFCRAKGLTFSGGLTSGILPETECRTDLTNSRINELQRLSGSAAQ